MYINWLDADQKDLKPEHFQIYKGGAMLLNAQKKSRPR